MSQVNVTLSILLYPQNGVMRCNEDASVLIDNKNQPINFINQTNSVNDQNNDQKFDVLLSLNKHSMSHTELVDVTKGRDYAADPLLSGTKFENTHSSATNSSSPIIPNMEISVSDESSNQKSSSTVKKVHFEKFLPIKNENMKHEESQESSEENTYQQPISTTTFDVSEQFQTPSSEQVENLINNSEFGLPKSKSNDLIFAKRDGTTFNAYDGFKELRGHSSAIPFYVQNKSQDGSMKRSISAYAVKNESQIPRSASAPITEKETKSTRKNKSSASFLYKKSQELPYSEEDEHLDIKQRFRNLKKSDSSDTIFDNVD